jgi:hypothetical protein
MSRHRYSHWAATLFVGVLSGAVWLIAALNGYAIEMLWLPAVALGAAWPRKRGQRSSACAARLRRMRDDARDI